MQPNAALAERLARDFEDRAFGRPAGDLAHPERSAPAPPPRAFVIPPPPWAVAQAPPDDPHREPDPIEESAA